MLTILLPSDVHMTIQLACSRSGARETGGMLFGEHIAEEEFRVAEVTVAGIGSLGSFVRSIADSLRHLNRFFERTRHDYQRFNYLGEWHSHPSFALVPSTTDDKTMFKIVGDPSTGARFAVSLIVRLEAGRLEAAAFAYYPSGRREDGRVLLEQQDEG